MNRYIQSMKGASLAAGLFLLTVFVFSVGTASAQNFYGSIAGTITDSTGAIVPDASVVVTNLGTAEKHAIKSDGSGVYRVINLVPAAYKVEVKAPSFKLFVQDNVTVQVDSTVQVNAALQPGTADQVVEVTSAPPALQTDSGTVATQVEGQVVTQMPLNGRNAMNLISLVPGVSPGNYTSGSASFNAGNRTQNGAWDAYQIGGGFTNENITYIDGASVNVLQENTIALILTQDALQEFKVASSVPNPEFGRFGGGVIEMTTKSGANAFHGSAYEYFRNTVLNADSFFAKFGDLPKSTFHQNQYGTTLGGPIRRDHAFFFFSWEDFSLRTANDLSTNVPTQAQRNGIFDHPIADPSGRCAIQANTPSPGQYTIPQSCMDSAAKVMINYFALPNSTTNASYNYVGSPTVGDDTSQYNGRIDYAISDKQRLFGRYTYWNLKDIGTNLFDNANGFPTGYAPTASRTHSVVLGDTYAFNPTTAADARISYVRQQFTNNAPSLGKINYGQFGPAYQALSSQITFQGLPNFLMIGNDNLYNLIPIAVLQFDYYDNYGISGSLSKIYGNHSLKFGVEGTLRLHNGTGNIHDGTGFATYLNSTTAVPGVANSGDELASFLLGEFSNDVIRTIKATTTFNYAYGLYASDTWKANRNLSLNFGLRYELPGGLEEKKDRTTVLLPGTTDPVTQIKPELALVNSSQYHSRSMEPYHYGLFSPRVSFAQSLHDGAEVVRGGYGLVYLPPDIPSGLMAFQSPINAALTTSLNGATPSTFLSNPFPSGILQPVGRTNPNFTQSFLGQAVSAPVPTSKYPYMQQWNLSFGQQWKGGWTTDIIYSGTKGTHLPLNVPAGLDQISTQDTQMLQAMENAGTPASTVLNYGLGLRPYPQYQNITNSADYSGSSTYNGLYLVLQKRFKSSGLLNVNYTWSKMLTDTDSASAQYGNSNAGGTASPQDFYNTRAEKSLASFDLGHRLLVNYVLNLPFGEGQPFARLTGVGGVLVSGWTVNGITTFQDGLPLAMSYSPNYLVNNLGAGTLRPNYVPGCAKKTSGSSFDKFRNNNWFNAACFTYPGDFSFGDEARVDPELRAQGLVNFDFSLLKTTTIRENMNLQFRAEAFNLFNHPYFNVPGTEVGGQGYNEISSQGNPPSPRLLQLSLRLNF